MKKFIILDYVIAIALLVIVNFGSCEAAAPSDWTWVSSTDTTREEIDSNNVYFNQVDRKYMVYESRSIDYSNGTVMIITSLVNMNNREVVKGHVYGYTLEGQKIDDFDLGRHFIKTGTPEYTDYVHALQYIR